MPEISSATRIRDLLREHPETRKVLARHGMDCPGCRGGEFETVRHAARNHGILLPDLLHELKAAIKPGT
jgi:hybrid cluster-associated redox disulfide protein